MKKKAKRRKKSEPAYNPHEWDESAIEFIRQTSTPPEPQFFPDFEDYIEVLRHVVR